MLSALSALLSRLFGGGSLRPAADTPAAPPAGVALFQNPAIAPRAAGELKVYDPGQIGAGAMGGAPQSPNAGPVTSTREETAAPLVPVVRGVGRGRDLRNFRQPGGSGVLSPSIPWEDFDNTPTEPQLHELGNLYWAGSNAVPDQRRIWGAEGKPAGYPEPVEAMRASPETVYNGVAPEPDNSFELDRPRAGAAQLGEGRPAWRRRYLFTRPFDKLAADSLTGHRDLMPIPLASTPLSFSTDVVGGIPSPGGSFAALGMDPVGIQPNSVRMTPRPWDEALVNNGALALRPTAGPDAQTAARSRSFRAGS